MAKTVKPALSVENWVEYLGDSAQTVVRDEDDTLRFKATASLYHEGAELMSIADRIEALLPPVAALVKSGYNVSSG